jgi:hypothetical protein
MEVNMEPQQIRDAFAEPFDAREVHWKPQSISGNRALAVAYIDARSVMDRLDSVVGIDGWQDIYECLPDGCVICRLIVRIDTEWHSKMDVGGPSDQEDAGDKRKAAVSDALKRCGVKYGIGRYLYSLPVQWLDWDAKARQFVKPPTLPRWALPGAGGRWKDPRKLPANGRELLLRLNKFEAALVKEGRCKAGDLVKYVIEAGPAQLPGSRCLLRRRFLVGDRGRGLRPCPGHRGGRGRRFARSLRHAPRATQRRRVNPQVPQRFPS